MSTINRITGTNSGIDVDSVVKQSLSSQQNKIDKAYQQEKVYEYQQEQLKEIVSQSQEFYDKYLDILSGDSLLKSSAYESVSFTSTDAKGNVSTAVTAKGYAGADVADYNVTVAQLATKATTKLTDENFPINGGKLNQNYSQIFIKMGEKEIKPVNVVVSSGKVDMEATAKALNSALKSKGINVTAKYSEIAKGIVIESGNMGASASFEIGFGYTNSKDETKTDNNEKGNSKSDPQFNPKEFKIITGQNAIGFIKKGNDIYTINKESNTFSVDNIQFTLNSVTDARKSEVDLEDKGPYIYNDQYIDKDGNEVKVSSDGEKKTTIITSKDGKTKTTTIIEGDKKTQTTESEGRTNRQTVSYLNNETGEWIVTSNKGGTMQHLINDDTRKLKSYTTLDGYSVIVSDDNTKTITSADGKIVTKVDSSGTETFDEVTLSGKTDISKLKDTIVKFVDDYNKLMTSIDEKLWEKRDKSYMPLTESQKKEMSESQIESWEKKAKTGLLKDDSDLRRIQSSMKEAMSSMMSGTGLTLESIGIEPVDNYTTKNGTFKIDDSKLSNALQNNAEEVKDLFTRAIDGEKDNKGKITKVTDKGGVLTQLKSVLKTEIKSSSSVLSKRIGFEGTATANNNTLKRNIDQQKSLIKQLQEQYKTKETDLYKKYSNLEVMLEKLNAQTNSLYSMLGISQ